MKNSGLKLLMIFVAITFIFTSCENSEAINDVEPISEEDTITTVEADDVLNDVDSLVDDLWGSIDASVAGKSEGDKNPYLSCMIKTRVTEGETTIVTLDFGSDCTLPFQNVVLSGKIMMEYIKDIEAKTITIIYSYDDFYYNDLKIEGTNEVSKIKENENGLREHTRMFDIKVIWPDGEFITRKGEKVRTLIGGYETKSNWGDNVFSITGSWNTTFKNGNVMSATIIEPLIRKTACRFIVSGTIEKQKNNRSGVLNFGDGTCDNVAIFTTDTGKEIEIVLRKRKR
ncbi:hypothetical protein SAMN06265371_103413 [Lutibacter agarilyticus]|uniref:Lipoprotein n=1 Tax=Lutibacter agarilyticus TaxID=1109740 RepID=A0A238WNA6_9FLAO|nr:hypothetical protein [Lutibacter agarilyticus]SNR48070.1 hypothetical protein SAMN06265371_103413 [Lutibacter agarilyticus]